MNHGKKENKMHDKLLKMMAKKKDAKPMPDMEKKAKLDSVNELRQTAHIVTGKQIGRAHV